MRDREDPIAFQLLILALLLDDDPRADEVVAATTEASIAPGEKPRPRKPE